MSLWFNPDTGQLTGPGPFGDPWQRVSMGELVPVTDVTVGGAEPPPDHQHWLESRNAGLRSLKAEMAKRRT